MSLTVWQNHNMAKLLNLMLLVFAVQIALVLFVVGPTGIPGGSLWTFLFNPTSWSDSDLLSTIFDTIAVAGVGLIVVGTFVYRSDFVTFAGITSIFLSFGSSLYNLWVYIQSNTGTSGNWIAAIFISPIILMYVYVILEFWRGKD
jgi:hypothetical protein